MGLRKEALYFKYHDKIAGAKSLEDMEEIRFSIMEEESPYFSAVSQRIWGEYEQKNEELSNPMQESEVIAEPEPQNEAEAPKEQPQIDKSGAVNFHIAPETEKSDGKGFAAKEKFRQNVEAIRTLEKIEGENRIATPEEQEILAKYVGWGGLADAFDETKTNWASEYQELKSLLSAEEYDSARESTLNAHYTSPVIIKAIYDAMERMGFSKGNILEPAMGIGNFFGMLPEKMQESRLYGVELDGITGRIARQLYPNADVKITGFEKTDYPNDFFDVAIGNVPFGQYKVADRAYDKHNFLMERQAAMIERQITEIEMAIEAVKAEKGERYTIKQMEKTKKSLDARLSRLNDTSRKDNVVTFEQLGVDRLFVDESHNYKNLFLYTKMRNVAGIAQTEAQKSSDMFAKCQYMDELTGGKGITFATGTPISNSMTELYTNMRYLQYSTLQKLGLGNFDSWAATFGETQTAIELAPEGTGYRAKTRFAKFFNLPELISLFKESADIQTPDMLKLPVPEAEYENVVLKPSEYQKEMVQSLADRAEAVRDRKVRNIIRFSFIQGVNKYAARYS